MPKIPGLRRRKDAFFIGRAIPKDLQGKGPYVTQSGRPQREIVRTLGTSDLKVARKRVHAEWAAMDREFEAERFKLANPHLESREFAARLKDLQKGDLKTVRLEDLDPRTEAVRFFAELERDSVEGIPELLARTDEDRLVEILGELREEAACLVGVPRGFGDNDGLDDFETYLERKGMVADPNASGLQKFADFFRRARLENIRRDITRIQRLPVTEGDPDFRAASLLVPAQGSHGHGSASSVNPGKTVGELVNTFLEHGRKAGRSTGTTRTYGTPARVMKGYFGDEKPLREIGTEEVGRLLDFLERYPKNAAQRYPGRSVIEAARDAEKSGDTDLMSKRSISNVFGVIAVMLNHAKHLV